MDDTALREACEALISKLDNLARDYDGYEFGLPRIVDHGITVIDDMQCAVLLAFKQQRAAGLREARAELRKGIMCSACVRTDERCEARAKAWEEGT